MRRIIKQGLVVALALGTLGSTAWAHDPSRWENFCYATDIPQNVPSQKFLYPYKYLPNADDSITQRYL